MDLSSKLFGNSNDYTFEHRLFNVVTLFSIVIAGVGKLINYYLEIVKLGSIPILVYLIITTLLYYNSRFRNKFRNYVWWYILSSIVLLSFIWLENGGYNSSNTLIFVLLFVVMSAIVKERRQFLIFVVLFIVLMALHLVAYFKPEYVGGYENEEIRFLDILITTLYIITALFAFLKIYRKNYIIEREKANSRKIEVEKLNKTLEDSNNKINIQNQKLEDLSNDLIKKHLIIKSIKQIQN
jgi:signal transduction histidine kinase